MVEQAAFPGTARLLRFETVQAVTGDSRTSHYEKIKRGLMTRAVKISERASAWPAHEIYAINTARIAGKSDAVIRALVAELQAQRLVSA